MANIKLVTLDEKVIEVIKNGVNGLVVIPNKSAAALNHIIMGALLRQYHVKRQALAEQGFAGRRTNEELAATAGEHTGELVDVTLEYARRYYGIDFAQNIMDDRIAAVASTPAARNIRVNLKENRGDAFQKATRIYRLNEENYAKGMFQGNPSGLYFVTESGDLVDCKGLALKDSKGDNIKYKNGQPLWVVNGDTGIVKLPADNLEAITGGVIIGDSRPIRYTRTITIYDTHDNTLMNQPKIMLVRVKEDSVNEKRSTESTYFLLYGIDPATKVLNVLSSGNMDDIMNYVRDDISMSAAAKAISNPQKNLKQRMHITNKSTWLHLLDPGRSQICVTETEYTTISGVNGKKTYSVQIQGSDAHIQSVIEHLQQQSGLVIPYNIQHNATTSAADQITESDLKNAYLKQVRDNLPAAEIMRALFYVPIKEYILGNIQDIRTHGALCLGVLEFSPNGDILVFKQKFKDS